MASKQKYIIKSTGVWERKKQWRARVKENEREYFLGYFATKGEAEEAEEAFRNER